MAEGATQNVRRSAQRFYLALFLKQFMFHLYPLNSDVFLFVLTQCVFTINAA